MQVTALDGRSWEDQICELKHLPIKMAGWEGLVDDFG